MGTIHIIPALGYIRKIESDRMPSVRELQGWVDGFTEAMNVTFNGKRTLMYVDENAAERDKPINKRATEFADQPVFGAAVVLEDIPC